MKDILIIGAGPVGLYAAYYAGLRGLNGYIVDGNVTFGGQPLNVYPDKDFYDIPGIQRISVHQYMKDLFTQYEQVKSKIEYKNNCTIVSYTKEKDCFIVKNQNNEEFKVRYILISTGIGMYSPIKLELPEIENKEIENIHYEMKDLRQFADKKIVILGGGDSAFDFGNELMGRNITKHVTLVHRRDQFRAKHNSIELFKTLGGSILTSLNVQEVKLSEKKINKVIFINPDTKITKELEVDSVIVQFGQNVKSSSVSKWEIDKNRRNQFIVDSAKRTSTEGIWAIGNACWYQGKTDLITVGFGEAINAVNDITKSIDPNAQTTIYFSK